MTSESSICHSGIIVETSQEKVFVKIIAQSACASCHAKNMCTISEAEEKIIEVSSVGSKHYEPGEEVSITMKRSMGNKAVLLGYLLPFLILVVSLFVFNYLTGNELHAGSISLLLPPYYLVLYLLRDKLKNSFTFEIQ